MFYHFLLSEEGVWVESGGGCDGCYDGGGGGCCCGGGCGCGVDGGWQRFVRGGVILD